MQPAGNTKRSVICNNCVGGMVLHDYGLQFNSPFVNLYITASDYLKVVSNIRHYTSDSATLCDVTGTSPFPRGLLQGDVTLNFMHYSSFEEAEKKWRQRCRRIDYENLYVIFVQQSSCNDTLLKQFDNLDFKNKIALVNRPVTGMKKQFIIPGWENDLTLGHITDYSDMLGHRYYDKFDWMEFLQLK